MACKKKSEQMVKQKDQALRQTKMVLKFREDALQKALKGTLVNDDLKEYAVCFITVCVCVISYKKTNNTEVGSVYKEIIRNN